MNDQFQHLAQIATQEVQEKGLAASPQAITVFSISALDRNLQARILRVDGKLVGTVLLSCGAIIGGIIRGFINV